MAREPGGNDPHELDFVVGLPDAAGDEEQLPDARGGRRRRWWPAVAGTALVAAATLLGLHAATGTSTHPPATRPSSHRPAAAGRAGGHASARHGQRPLGETLGEYGNDAYHSTLVIDRNPLLACPDPGDGSPGCTTSRTVPAPVEAAVRERFPGSHLVSEFEEQLRDVGFGPGGLWYREVRVRQGSRSIAVIVHPRRLSDRPGAVEHVDGGGALLIVTRIVRGDAVQIRVRRPAGRPAPRRRAHALFAFAADARLRTRG